MVMMADAMISLKTRAAIEAAEPFLREALCVSSEALSPRLRDQV
jgi:hypothetical protein